jgi:endogenous inhibitor of DNA gyrase (YacG/DUF329 family)
MLWNRIKVTCVVCQKVVIRNNKAETCSIHCRDIVKRQRLVDQAPVGICPVCGTSGPLLRRSHDVPVCSTRCKSTLYARQHSPRPLRARKIEKDRREIALGSERACVWCQTKFTVRRHDARCCSRACTEKAYRARTRAGDLVRYARAREARNIEIGSCTLCGVTYARLRTPDTFGIGGHLGATTFHRDHIVPRSRGGGEGRNVRWVCWFCNWTRRNLPAAYDPAIAAAGRAFWKTTGA